MSHHTPSTCKLIFLCARCLLLSYYQLACSIEYLKPLWIDSCSYNFCTHTHTEVMFTSLQAENSPLRWMPVWHTSSDPQPHPAVLPHLRRSETADMAQSSGCQQEALGTHGDTAADCRLCLTHQTKNLAWPGTQKKKSGLVLVCLDCKV